MNDIQRHSLLTAIAVSSGVAGVGAVTHQQRAEAFSNLEEFKNYPGRVAACVELIGCGDALRINGCPGNAAVDVAVPAKLYALGVLRDFLRVEYTGLNDSDRAQLRSNVLAAARQLAVPSSDVATPDDASKRILATKIAALLADLALREFPQRWGTFVSDVFSPVSAGGIWCEPGAGVGASMTGVKICLECLKLITEDCTDSDFNSKISTTRRNDILLGLNEMSNRLLPSLLELLSKQYVDLGTTKATLKGMHVFLASSGRTTAQMTPDERTQYQQQLDWRDAAGSIIADALGTLEKFCQSMPIDWMFKAQDGVTDFVAAFLHLLKEDTANIQVLSLACFHQLAMRKLEYEQWFRLISAMPSAFFEANNAAVERASEKGIETNSDDMLVDQLEFHRSLSKMSSALISAHLAHITTDKDIATGKGPKFDAVSSFFRLLSDMAMHRSGVICGEQINTWVGLLRDPSVVRTKVLSPFIGTVLTAYMTHIVRIRWDDVWEQTHPNAKLIEASWDDDDDYDNWLVNLRSKASQLFKFIGSTEPEVSASIIHSKIRTILAAHSTGEPRDCLNPENNELTQTSTACLEFEGSTQPLDNILSGIPSWAVDDGNYDEKRSKIRSSVRPLLAEVANMIVSWNPNDVWLKFRRTTLLEALKHYWKHDPTTLLTGVDSLLVYLNAQDNHTRASLSVDLVALRKKCGVSLVAVAKVVPSLLVPWLSQLSERAKSLLTSSGLLPTNQMHLYEFLSCVATAVENPTDRSAFIADVLAFAIQSLETSEVQTAVASADGLLSFMGVAQASQDPSCVTNAEFVEKVTRDYVNMFSAFNQLLSVGKRCHEAAKKRPNGGLPMQNLVSANPDAATQHFPDEGPISLSELMINDPFVPLWTKFLPTLIRVLDVTLHIWHPEYQAVLLRNNIQRYALAISDDEAYLATKQEHNNGGVFGKGGTAGSIVAGCDRRDENLVPKWAGWFNELRNTCFQLFGLLAAQRVLFAPEVSHIFPQLVSVIANPEHLRAMEHRHLSQYLKQFIEIVMVTCPAPLYQSHLTAILGPVFEHLQYRLQCTWDPIIGNRGLSVEFTKPLLSSTSTEASQIFESKGADAWFAAYYARGGLFVGDLDNVTAEAAVDKVRVELSRTFCDMIQTTLALKGGWALVLANKYKEEQATRRNDPSKLTSGPRNRISEGNGPVNANGTPRSNLQLQLDARMFVRIDKMCHFLLLENERIAGSLVLTVIQCLEYPDAYTCRRCTRIVHRIMETVAWVDRYTDIIGHRLLSVAVKAIVTEPKWMVGTEWDMINIIRDIYGRLVLGQYFAPGGQGPGLQMIRDPSNNAHFEQSKVFDKPLQGGGILTTPSDHPRRVLLEYGMSPDDIKSLEFSLSDKRSAKEQKDVLRDFLRVAAEKIKQSEGGIVGGSENAFERVGAEESLLQQNIRKPIVGELPEKLGTTYSKAKKDADNMAETQQAEIDAMTGSRGLDIFKL